MPILPSMNGVEPNGNSMIALQKAKLIEIDGRDAINSVVFLADGKYVVSGGDEGKIRYWRVEDGEEERTPMDAESAVYNVGASQDGTRVVSGTKSGFAAVWDTQKQKRVIQPNSHTSRVCAVDISPDGSKLASGSDDRTVRVWSIPTGKRLLDPLKHEDNLAAVKFSPNGLLIATATWGRESIRIYNVDNGRLLTHVPIKVKSWWNQSLAWGCDGKQLFVLSHDGHINCVNVSTGATVSRWRIHSCEDPSCIALASNGAFIAVSDASSVSLWDTTTFKQIGSVIRHEAKVWCMAISANNDLAMGVGSKIILRSIGDILPSQYFDSIYTERAMQRVKAERAHLEETIQSLYGKIAHLEKTIQELREEIATSQHAATQEKDVLNDTIRTLREQDKNSNAKNMDLTVQLADSQHETEKLRGELATSQLVATGDKDSNEQVLADLKRKVQELTTSVKEKDKRIETLLEQAKNSSSMIAHPTTQLAETEQGCKCVIM